MQGCNNILEMKMELLQEWRNMQRCNNILEMELTQ